MRAVLYLLLLFFSNKFDKIRLLSSAQKAEKSSLNQKAKAECEWSFPLTRMVLSSAGAA
jgi:hypothetical protein